ncbi:AAA family ATPase [Candidatus Pantoea gossypiicola]|uniref:AAA family ATPase n=1 Tax=Candidatus Pantoea gossypiicola TaxID=2608008 RepID=A0AB34CDC0_9GAMM|nr:MULTISPECIES: AAA family ATPase [Pantoea]KAA5981387.1 AAA family ATPase [Pantoea sp. M_4]KAA6120125.1 AAA family ATPase [Pantoea gossypiicola]
MTTKKSTLQLNRLVVYYGIKKIYDEDFHAGVNIIRGEHSVGKSTILDMIFYVLGGEPKKDDWKYPADVCSNVLAEISVNKKTITLKRQINSEGGIPHIEIYDGNYDKAIKDVGDWSDYGSRRNNDKLSFSEIMFELFDWGQYKSSDYHNLTMHQIMRLIYLSQSSDSNRIFRKESTRSDNENTRLAIAEFLLGLDDLETHSYRQSLLKNEREYEISGTELRTYFEVLGNTADLTVEKINEAIEQKKVELDDINAKRSLLLDKNGTFDDLGENNISNERNMALEKSHKLTMKINTKNIELDSIKIELQDCILFGKSLNYRMKALNESKDTYQSLGKISFDYCPCCFTPISDSSKEDEAGCALCKASELTASLTEKYIETLNELQYQTRQNETIIRKLSENIEYLEGFIAELNIELQSTQNKLFDLSLTSNHRELAIAEIIEERTAKLLEISSLNEKIESASKVDNLIKRREYILQKIEACRNKITALEAKNAERRTYVYKILGDISTNILEMDSGNEEKFKSATSLSTEIDFAKDRWLLNERVNYSDSSNVVKKAALHLAFLLFSITDEYCRYPRFSIMDFECGDINEERSQNLQKIITSCLDGKVDYQLIMTTSKVAPSLNNDELGVGRFYGKNDYILKI